MAIRVRCPTCESFGESPVIFEQLTPGKPAGVIDYRSRAETFPEVNWAEMQVRMARRLDEAHRRVEAQHLWEAIHGISIVEARDRSFAAWDFDPLEYFRGLVSHALVTEQI